MDLTGIPPQLVLADIPLVVEDLPAQADEQLAKGADATVVDDLLAQVADLQGR